MVCLEKIGAVLILTISALAKAYRRIILLMYQCMKAHLPSFPFQCCSKEEGSGGRERLYFIQVRGILFSHRSWRLFSQPSACHNEMRLLEKHLISSTLLFLLQQPLLLEMLPSLQDHIAQTANETFCAKAQAQVGANVAGANGGVPTSHYYLCIWPPCLSFWPWWVQPSGAAEAGCGKAMEVAVAVSALR